jgi:hypothetical protein
MDSSDDDKPVMQLIANKMKSNGNAVKEPVKPTTPSVADSKGSSNTTSNKDNDSNNNNKKITCGSNSSKNEDSAIDGGSSKTNNPLSDSDDDIPIVELVKKRKNELDEIRAKKRAKEERENERIRLEKERAAKDKERQSRDKDRSREKERDSKDNKSSSSRRESTPAKSSSSSAAASKSAEFYETLKGQLVQKLLIRWWYAIEWPKESEIGHPPPGYESLDGFKGVFVSTRTDSLGQILDLRDKTNCPCLSNLVKKPSSELKELAVTAIKNQMTALKAAEGEDCRMLEDLSSELGEIKKIDADKADRQGRQYENAFGVKNMKAESKV